MKITNICKYLVFLFCMDEIWIFQYSELNIGSMCIHGKSLRLYYIKIIISCYNGFKIIIMNVSKVIVLIRSRRVLQPFNIYYLNSIMFTFFII